MAAEDEGLRLVATDSYRLSVRDLVGTSILGEDQTVLVPSRALTELHRIIGDSSEITLRLAARDASFDVAETRLTTRLIEAISPTTEALYPPIIPTSSPSSVTSFSTQ